MRVSNLGSLGADATDPSTLSTPTLANPTIVDPVIAATQKWQQDVLAAVQSGALTLKTEELQRWLQIAATLSIPLAAAIWRAIFRRGASSM
jgi:hypothetical protein